VGRVLTAHHGKRIAVIQNEFGEDLGLGSTVAAEGVGGEVFEECYEMNNGCICCSVRDELVNTLESIMTKRHKFDYVLVETTGMANPGPIASIFWLDDELGSDLFLDAIITLIDAKHMLQHLDDPSPSGGRSVRCPHFLCFCDERDTHVMQALDPDFHELLTQISSHNMRVSLGSRACTT
jgi:G3E family GTPase